MNAVSAEAHAIYQIANAPLRPYPFPHLYVEEIFPPDYYRRLLAMLPPDEAYHPIEEVGSVPQGSYRERTVIMPVERDLARIPASQRPFWAELFDWLHGGSLVGVTLERLRRPDEWRGRKLQIRVYLGRDRGGYRIGPHTDHRDKLITLLFYLPRDQQLVQHGTTLYRPRRPIPDFDPNCHYEEADFEAIYTAPFRPNSLFAFARSDHSFHGVQRLPEGEIRRDLLIVSVIVRR